MPLKLAFAAKVENFTSKVLASLLASYMSVALMF